MAKGTATCFYSIRAETLNTVSSAFCSIGISGWYHGRTAGLLGTYDNERFNDLTDASRKVNNVVEEFANSWEVSPSFCRTRNTAGNDVIDELLPEVQACNAYLNSSSSYYTPCFEQV